MTLEESNILWLRGRARSGKARSLSEALDTLITSARQSGYGAEIRSAVGTIDVSPEDPDLLKADAAIRKMFDAWLDAQPAMLTSRSTDSRKRTRSRKAANRG